MQPRAFYLPAGNNRDGQRFCIFHPCGGASLRGLILYVHPFAEELNKTRRMAALQSRALAAAGYAVLQIDLLGCGDSSGDFGDAAWDDWVKDIVEAGRWLRQQGSAPLWLWGLRAGSLLATEAADRMDETCHFLFWQTPASGKQLLQQFLRLKAASQMQGGSAKHVMDDLRHRLAEGEAVEVAGYTISAMLAQGLEASMLRRPEHPGRVEWFSIAARAEAAPAAASAEVTRWQQAGFAVRSHAVQGPAFWQTAEVEEAPALVAATVAALAEPAAPVSHCLERVLELRCGGETLFGVLATARRSRDTAVLIVVGGPQYRVGSHRQFVLLARRVADAGYPVLRFDYRGMGDSGGDMRDFESVSEDIGARRRCACSRPARAFGASCCGAFATVLRHRCSTWSASPIRALPGCACSIPGCDRPRAWHARMSSITTSNGCGSPTSGESSPAARSQDRPCKACWPISGSPESAVPPTTPSEPVPGADGTGLGRLSWRHAAGAQRRRLHRQGIPRTRSCGSVLAHAAGAFGRRKARRGRCRSHLLRLRRCAGESSPSPWIGCADDGRTMFWSRPLCWRAQMNATELGVRPTARWSPFALAAAMCVVAGMTAASGAHAQQGENDACGSLKNHYGPLRLPG